MLPEKWYIIRNKENAKVVNEWNNKTYVKHNNAFRDDYAVIYSNKSYQNESPDRGYTEITFQQFLEEVLGQKPQVNNTYAIF